MAEQIRPWTWTIPEASADIKKRMTRQDGFDRVSGHAVYTRDIYLPVMLYAKILTSPFAHAKIVSIDTSKAEALVGVRDIMKYDDPDIRFDNVTGVDFSNQYNILALPGISDFYQPHLFLPGRDAYKRAYGYSDQRHARDPRRRSTRFPSSYTGDSF